MKQLHPIRIVPAAILLLVLSITTPTNASAGILAQELSPCGAGCERQYAAWTLYKDDCTGEIFTFMIDCDQSTYYNVPNPWCAINPLPPNFNPFPTDFWTQIASANFSTPGADCGYYITNVDGSYITFHNPNSSELARAQAAYECTFGGGLH